LSRPLAWCKRTSAYFALRRVATAGGLCLFPSRWNLASNWALPSTTSTGRCRPTMSETESAHQRFFRTVEARSSFWRLNWTLIDSPALHQPTSARRAPTANSPTGLSGGRQTLRRLAGERRQSSPFTTTWPRRRNCARRTRSLRDLLYESRHRPPAMQDTRVGSASLIPAASHRPRTTT